MRSRFTAYALRLKPYLLTTWHPDFCPDQLDLSGSPEWVFLEVLSAREQSCSAQVHYMAIWRSGKDWGCLEERADFVRENGLWYYTQGATHEYELRPHRNAPCPCGSGRKFKKCCLDRS